MHGLRITGGFVDCLNDDIFNECGGAGIFNNYADVMMHDCRVFGNNMSYQLFINGEGTKDQRWRNSGGWGAIYSWGGWLGMSSCEVDNNYGWMGAGIANIAGNLRKVGRGRKRGLWFTAWGCFPLFCCDLLRVGSWVGDWRFGWRFG
jgi:hypothetical protein